MSKDCRLEFPESVPSWGTVTHRIVYGYEKTFWNKILIFLGIAPEMKVLYFETKGTPCVEDDEFIVNFSTRSES